MKGIWWYLGFVIGMRVRKHGILEDKSKKVVFLRCRSGDGYKKVYLV